MIKAIEKPANKLFNRVFPEILNIEDGSYICLSNDLFAKGKSQEQIESAINRQMAHYSYHCGQIVFLAKHFGHAEWKSLSVPRKQSAEFNRRVSAGEASQR